MPHHALSLKVYHVMYNYSVSFTVNVSHSSHLAFVIFSTLRLAQTLKYKTNECYLTYLCDFKVKILYNTLGKKKKE